MYTLGSFTIIARAKLPMSAYFNRKAKEATYNSFRLEEKESYCGLSGYGG